MRPCWPKEGGKWGGVLSPVHMLDFIVASQALLPSVPGSPHLSPRAIELREARYIIVPGSPHIVVCCPPSQARCAAAPGHLRVRQPTLARLCARNVWSWSDSAESPATAASRLKSRVDRRHKKRDGELASPQTSRQKEGSATMRSAHDGTPRIVSGTTPHSRRYAGTARSWAAQL